MDHNYVRNDNFNFLTLNYDKKGLFHVTGETKEPLDVGDTINYIVNEKFDILGVTKIKERRDSRDYPKGNGMFYSVECKLVPKPEVVK
jgi:hypothetical protein